MTTLNEKILTIIGIVFIALGLLFIFPIKCSSSFHYGIHLNVKVDDIVKEN